MKEPWQAAELLEEIAKKADPTSALASFTSSLLDNSRAAGAPIGIAMNQKKSVMVVTCSFPVTSVMSGMDGTAEQVSEWLSTGANADQTVLLENDSTTGIRCFIVKQVYREQSMIDDMNELLTKMEKRYQMPQ